ncbi:MAG TPA: GTPase ObgE [Solirubrobacterales bacterium]|nr:GTPase ObgE [Solirubrobacterales bacterium]
MLYDRATIHVEAGGGGHGCVSFRREAHVPRGGPDGGDGGRGADVVVVADAGLRDLALYRHKRHFRGQRGGHGEGKQRQGASGDELVLRVPVGTVVEDLAGGVRHDLSAPGRRAVLARGGAGGSGNKRFATSTRQAPRFAERGLPGEEATIELRLKLLADVGLVGLPNAGKSSLLSRLTRAHPKVADYPFTTLEPVVGTLEDDEGRQLVLADIPGLIEGAADGAGLGHEFLAHVERTSLLVHVVDVAPLDGLSPWDAFATVRAELERYGAGLEERPFLVALNKVDLVPPQQAEQLVAEWRDRLESHARVCRDPEPVVLAVSAATGAGLDELRLAVLRWVPAPPPAAAADGPVELAEHTVYRPGDDGWSVERTSDSSFRVHGAAVERLVGRHDLDNAEALAYIEERLKSMGVIKRLEAAGFEPGHEIEIGDVAFALYPGVAQQ